MSARGDGPVERKIILGIGAVLAGFAVMVAVVMVTTWLAMVATGLRPADGPTSVYLALNLAGTLLAAMLGGAAARRIGGTSVPVWALAAGVLVTAISAIGDPAPGQPAWYPAAVAAVGIGGVLAGGLVFGHDTRRPPSRAAEAAERV